MRAAAAALLLAALGSCRSLNPDHSDPPGQPPRASEELTWETFFHEPWPDPLHEKYADLFGAPYPAAGNQHFETKRPFADVRKYDLAFENTAIPGARAETETAAGRHTVSLMLPGSAGRPIAVRPGTRVVTLVMSKPGPPRRWRAYRAEERVVPLPPLADPASARLTRDGDWVRITFAEKTSGGNDGK